MNSVTVLSLFFAIVATVSAGYYKDDHAEDNGPAHYKFEYGVYDPHTGDKKEQQEHRDGHNLKGSYTFKEADGTTRVVEYYSDPHKGFNAIVKRIGHAYHPQHYKVYGGHGGEVGVGGGGHGQAHSYVGVTHYGYQH